MVAAQPSAYNTRNKTFIILESGARRKQRRMDKIEDEKNEPSKKEKYFWNWQSECDESKFNMFIWFRCGCGVCVCVLYICTMYMYICIYIFYNSISYGRHTHRKKVDVNGKRRKTYAYSYIMYVLLLLLLLFQTKHVRTSITSHIDG